ncbi:hypothetical protein ACRRTK_020068 [Alexandromys fortis]
MRDDAAGRLLDYVDEFRPDRGTTRRGHCGTKQTGEDPGRSRNATDAKRSSAGLLHRRPLASPWRRNSASKRFPGHRASTKRLPVHGCAVRECADSCAEPNSHRTDLNQTLLLRGSVPDQADDVDRCESAADD